METHEMGETVLCLALGVVPTRYAHWQATPPDELVQRDQVVREQFAQERRWGMEASIDLSWCDPARISDPTMIHAFAVALYGFIGMRRYGEPLIVHFGQEERVSSYTLVQCMETSHITAHFMDRATRTHGNVGCLNIFSCASFAPYAAAAFCQQWFGAREVEAAVTFRGPIHEGNATTVGAVSKEK